MSTHVFLGPTLSRADAQRHLDATYHPPIGQGDVLRVLAARPSAILIVDGYFQFVPSVWHKEVLTALECGIPVYGASSMGALRAAELADFGMIGVGQVFRWFKNGVLQDDDEVAVAHAGSEHAFQPLSEALVNIRDVCQTAAARSVIGRGTAERIVEIAKRMHYSERHWKPVEGEARRTGVDPDELSALGRFRKSLRHNLKQRDAVQALRLLARTNGRPPRLRQKPPLRVEPTVFLGALKREVEAETSQSSKQEAGTALDVARKKVLLGILASREMQRRGYALGTERVSPVTDWFSKSYGVPTGAGLDVWLAARGLTQTMFDQAMQRFAAVVEAQDQLAEDIERELPAYWKLHPASDGGDAQWTQINVSLDRARGTAAQSARRLFRRLMPLVTTERRLLRIESFHFTRKTPDLRLRFLCRGSADRLIPRLERLLRGSRSGIEAAFPSVYEPEHRLFGGELAMDAVHRYFEQDSLMAIRWLERSRSVEGVGSAALCFRVVDDLFARALEGGSEIWDAWNIVRELSSTLSRDPGDKSAAFAVRLSNHETSILRSCRRANAELADALVSLWHQGSLGVGLRMLVAYVAMFHFNRYGLDGTVQADVARFAIDRRNPTVTAASRGPADRG